MEYDYILNGRVYPDRVHFTLMGLPDIEFSHSDFLIKGKFKIEIVDCIITIHFNTSEIISEKSEPNLNTLKNILEDLSRSFVDLYCFLHSYSYDLDLETITCEELKLNYTFPVQGEYDLQDDNNENYTKLVSVSLSGAYPFFNNVFADFRRSIKYPGMTAGFCFRAIETIRQSYFGIFNANSNCKSYKKEREKRSWDNFNRTLGSTQNDHISLVEWSKRNRHGDYPVITYEQRVVFMNHTREIINRFVDLVTK